ncbi:hypothetical protein [Nocardioides mangrovi]|uniref:Uncharacterized protein n=1 Tax=Nocardioides mangrovi TaxID=2874580 RepID=A0ABS7U8A0_9ACTN|nr:hypothetical protein [Nocardioides mangrovi]MBZ5737115.1 hypothetical protein [Nocardioides mangrovi]
MPLYHVTSSLNRASIREFGLDWDRMGAATGIAGSRRPETAGCFLAYEWSVDFFLRFHEEGSVDVWQVDGVDETALVDWDGFHYLPARIPPAQLTLLRTNIPPRR